MGVFRVIANVLPAHTNWLHQFIVLSNKQINSGGQITAQK